MGQNGSLISVRWDESFHDYPVKYQIIHTTIAFNNPIFPDSTIEDTTQKHMTSSSFMYCGYRNVLEES